ncbi:MAG TPA: class I SAM-dependent methyltransferase [Thermotogota bacterium]|nr:class I SAM-dependent methyltransferase [Thermotogota bacterium]HPH11872.1 class I SAM-dependent methyltransferase [Thermotogota bacterium]
MESKTITQKPEYGNWVSLELIRKVFFIFLLFTVVDAALWAWLPGWLPLKITVTLLVLFTLTATIYFCFARYLFSPEGKDVQNQITDLLLSRISWNGDGKALDIGCGSGALTIKIAKKYGNAHITGVDYWDGSWGYSKKRCEENSRIEGVSSRTDFIKADASKLPFADHSFDAVVSNLTFHEVKSSRDKYVLIDEALRVLKNGGCFVFQDLFLFRACYPHLNEHIELLRKSGIGNITFLDTSKSSFIPRALKLPFMAGTIGILYGTK